MEVNWSQVTAMVAIAVSIWSVLHSIQAQKRLARIQGSGIHKKRADIVDRMLLKYRAYTSDLKAFTQAKDKETFWKYVQSGADKLIDIYHRFAENDLYFTPKERKRIYKGADALETTHRLLRDIYIRYWEIKGAGDPANDPWSNELKANIEARQKALQRDMRNMHGLLMKLIGLK